jgi:Na+/proline symporter
MNAVYIYLGIYMTIILAISIYIARKENKEDFLIAGRDRRWWQILLSKFAASIGVGWFVTYTAYAYEFGYGVFAAVAGMLIGYFIFAYWAAPKIFKHSKENKFYTQGDFIAFQTKSKLAKKITNYITILIQLLWVVIAITGGSKIISHIGIISYEAALLLTSIFVLIYILLAGFKAVMLTDIFQAIIIIALLMIISVVLIGHSSISQLLTIETNPMGMATIIGFLLYGGFAVFSQADRFQLCYAAKTKRELQKGLWFAVIPITFCAILLLLIGLFILSQNNSLDPALVFFEAMNTFLPQALVPFGIVLFFAGLMSSADTGIYTITSHYILTNNTHNKIKKIRMSSITLIGAVILFSLLYQDIVGLSLLAGAMSLTLSIPMIYILSGGTNKRKYLISIVGSFFGLVLGILTQGITPTILIFPLIFSILFLIGYTITRKIFFYFS